MTTSFAGQWLISSLALIYLWHQTTALKTRVAAIQAEVIRTGRLSSGPRP